MPDRKKIPALTIERLCSLYGELDRMIERGQKNTDSNELEKITGIAAHTIRKDISLLANEAIGSGRTGYDAQRLSAHIRKSLGIEKPLACIVGLGRLGTALLEFRSFLDCEIVAGFDSSHNRIELLNTDIALFPRLAHGTDNQGQGNNRRHCHCSGPVGPGGCRFNGESGNKRGF